MTDFLTVDYLEHWFTSLITKEGIDLNIKFKESTNSEELNFRYKNYRSFIDNIVSKDEQLVITVSHSKQQGDLPFISEIDVFWAISKIIYLKIRRTNADFDLYREENNADQRFINNDNVTVIINNAFGMYLSFLCRTDYLISYINYIYKNMHGNMINERGGV